jgi:hypothetical protein
MRRPPTAPSLWLPAAVLLLVAAVTLVRGVQAAGGVLLTGSGEHAHYGWAAGDPRLEERLLAAAPSLPPAAGVRLIVPAGTELGWATFRGLYHLPQQRVLSVHWADAAPTTRDAWIVDLTTPEPRITPPQPPSKPLQR